jgi:hypothetical protein
MKGVDPLEDEWSSLPEQGKVSMNDGMPRIKIFAFFQRRHCDEWVEVVFLL